MSKEREDTYEAPHSKARDKDRDSKRPKRKPRAEGPFVPDAREYYTAAALTGLFSMAKNSQDAENAATLAVRVADQVITSLEETPTPAELEAEAEAKAEAEAEAAAKAEAEAAKAKPA